MNIVHTVDYFHPMMGYQENHLSRIQAAEGHSVSIVTSSSLTPWQTPFDDTIREADSALALKGVQVIRLNPCFEYSHRVLLPGMYSAMRQVAPELVHAHGWATLSTIQCCLWKRRLSYRLLIDDHMLYAASSHRFSSTFNRSYRLLFSPYIERRADRIVSVSDETTDFLSRIYGVSLDRIEHIPLGVDRRVFKPDLQARREQRLLLGIGETEIVAIYTGKMNVEKDPLKVLRAALPLWKEGLEFRFVLIGYCDRRYRGGLESFIQKNNLQGKVMILPAVPTEELGKYFSMADLAVWPCRSSMSALEAMSCGCPVMLANLPANIERTRSGSGVIYDGTESDLSRKMKALIEDPVKRKTMGENGVKATMALDWHELNKRFLSTEVSSQG